MGNVGADILNVLVIGSGANVENELAQINRNDFDVIIGVNRAAILYGPVDYHCSLHPREYAPIKAAKLISHKHTKGVDEVLCCQWRPGGNSGSSGLFAVKYALERLKADHVTLVGVGMNAEPHIYNNIPWPQALMFQRTWKEVLPILKGRVTSLGGWTAQLLNN